MSPPRAYPPRVTAVIPTLGVSPYLSQAVEALRRDAGEEMEILVVWQGGGAEEIPGADRILRPAGHLGFAGATNLGIAEARGELIATVNDDLLVEPGWTRALLEALDAHPQAACAQGVNLLLAQPQRTDGAGLAWNRSWQAVQIGHGEPAEPPGEPREVFGVSATAAVYRRQLLLALGEPFDPRLESYYEDVDLACRLRAQGAMALCVPRARARHAGSATGGRRPWRRWALIYGNRYLVLARCLGRQLWLRLPVIVGRDILDLVSAVLHLDGAHAAGIVAGWVRALLRLHGWARSGPPLFDLQTRHLA